MEEFRVRYPLRNQGILVKISFDIQSATDWTMRSDSDPITRSMRQVCQHRLIPLVIVEQNSDADTNSETEAKVTHNKVTKYAAPFLHRFALSDSTSVSGLGKKQSRSLSLDRYDLKFFEPGFLLRRRCCSYSEIEEPRSKMNHTLAVHPVPVSRATQAIGEPCLYFGTDYWNKLTEFSFWRPPSNTDWRNFDESSENRLHVHTNDQCFWLPENHQIISDSQVNSYVANDPPTNGYFFKPASVACLGPWNYSEAEGLSPQFTLSPSISLSTVAVGESSWVQSGFQESLGFSQEILSLPGPSSHFCKKENSMIHSTSTPQMDYLPEHRQLARNNRDSVPPLLQPPVITLCRPSSMNEFERVSPPNSIAGVSDHVGCKFPGESSTDRRKSVPNFSAHYRKQMEYRMSCPATSCSTELVCATQHSRGHPETYEQGSHHRFSLNKLFGFKRLRERKKLSLQDNHMWTVPSDIGLFESSNYLTVPTMTPDVLTPQASISHFPKACKPPKPRALSIDFGSVLARKHSSVTAYSTSTTSTQSSTGQLTEIAGHLINRLSPHIPR